MNYSNNSFNSFNQFGGSTTNGFDTYGRGGHHNLGCGCTPCNPCNPCNACCPKAQPIVMPTQLQVSKRVTAQEQPVIVPIERRTINQCMYYPRYYPVVQNTFYNQF